MNTKQNIIIVNKKMVEVGIQLFFAAGQIRA